MAETGRERSGPEVAPPAVARTSRRARILQRTWFGAGLVLVTAGVLWLAHEQGDPRPVLFSGAFVAFLAAIETSLMGRLFLRGLPVILVVPLVGVVLAESASLEFPPSGGPLAQLGTEILIAAILATLVHLLTRALPRKNLLRQLLILALCMAMVGGFAWVDARGRGPSEYLPAIAAAAVALGALSIGICRTRARRIDLAISVGLALWIAVPLPALAQVARLWDSAGLVSLIVLSKVGDIAGYYVGNAIGSTHPFPKLSPGKTTAGCVGSLVAGVLSGGALAWAGILPQPVWGIFGGLLAGLCVNLAAQAGDLLESLVKRRAGVKDSSSWLGPSGGVLDVVDSFLLSVAAALVFWPLLLAS